MKQLLQVMFLVQLLKLIMILTHHLKNSQTLVHVATEGQLQVKGTLTEYDLANIKTGQNVKIKSKFILIKNGLVQFHTFQITQIKLLMQQLLNQATHQIVQLHMITKLI